MKVIAYDPFLSPERATTLGVERVELATLIRRADFITLHTPLTDKTRNILGAEALAASVTVRSIARVDAASLFTSPPSLLMGKERVSRRWRRVSGVGCESSNPAFGSL